jgi:hypothetical protein
LRRVVHNSCGWTVQGGSSIPYPHFFNMPISNRDP